MAPPVRSPGYLAAACDLPRASTSRALVADQSEFGSASQTWKLRNEADSPATVKPRFAFLTLIDESSPKTTGPSSSCAEDFRTQDLQPDRVPLARLDGHVVLLEKQGLVRTFVIVIVLANRESAGRVSLAGCCVPSDH